MHALKRITDAIQRPIAEHEQAAIDEYSEAMAQRYAVGMGLTGAREQRLESHRRASSRAPRIHLARR